MPHGRLRRSFCRLHAVPREPAGLGAARIPPGWSLENASTIIRAASEWARSGAMAEIPGEGGLGVRPPRRCSHSRGPSTLACPGPRFGVTLCFCTWKGKTTAKRKKKKPVAQQKSGFGVFQGQLLLPALTEERRSRTRANLLSFYI